MAWGITGGDWEDSDYEPEVVEMIPGDNCCPDCGDPDCYGTCCDYDEDEDEEEC